MMEELATASPTAVPQTASDPYPTPKSLSSSSATSPPPLSQETPSLSFPPRTDSRPSAPVPALSPAQEQPKPQPQKKIDVALPPEIDDLTYWAEVLHLEGDSTEGDIDHQLQDRAQSLGISLNRCESPEQNPLNSGALSSFTISTPAQHARTNSSTSNNSASTALTTHSSMAISTPATVPSTANTITTPPLTKKRSKSLSFSQYEKYLAELDPNINQPKNQAPRPNTGDSSHGIFNPKSYKSFKHGIKTKVGWKKRASHGAELTMLAVPIPSPVRRLLTPHKSTCICCREDFQIDKTHQLRILPCGHTYCASCLHIIITQATVDESKMPPRCCTQPLPSSIVKAILTKEEQQAFLKAVMQFNTPWESRIFCTNPTCGEFIPPRKHVDPKHPFEVMCRQCKRRVCVMCKRNAHPIGQDCPDDWELETVLKMGEKSGWRRCYKCRNLVELSIGCTHMTCRCKAQFCYICGAIWDPVVGCPNFCNGEEELERRQREEEARVAKAEAEKAAREAAAAAEEAARAEAEKRTQDCVHFKIILKNQQKEMDRFITYEKTIRWKLWLRHADQKKELGHKYDDLTEKMKERHAKTAAHLEDRQVAAEMELRNSLDHQEKSVRIRLRHMEAYCDGEGTSPDIQLPPRIVTERDRRELGQQYRIRDGIERLHQAKINVMRDRQAKRMEELLERQEIELEMLAEKHEKEVEDLATQFAHEEDAIVQCLDERKGRMCYRWRLGIEILRAEIEDETGLMYATPPIHEWPTIKQIVEYKLASVNGSESDEKN
ncbi:IBR domain-containing protein [Zalerion maritima]|uniref:RBR-type E3 ubiquitin transferase n=1 Tax=Zalerion maritima TaxID=339359 RepID=A0AAD5WS20_9PEZI|nr:IBR domain-containing protein [Zalerion maritima]